ARSRRPRFSRPRSSRAWHWRRRGFPPARSARVARSASAPAGVRPHRSARPAGTAPPCGAASPGTAPGPRETIKAPAKPLRPSCFQSRYVEPFLLPPAPVAELGELDALCAFKQVPAKTAFAGDVLEKELPLH